ncbi:MAG: tetratricopeptide repeat protein [Bryobacteraceae bacterium]
MRFMTLTALMALAAELFAQTTRLELGKVIQDDLSGGQTRSYPIMLEANQYLRAVVTQPVAAVVVGLYSPDGKKVLEVDTGNFSKEHPRIVWVTETAGEYRVSVTVPGKSSDASHYEIKLEDLRAAGPDDGKRVEAERLFTQGLSEAGKNGLDQTISSYSRALGLYREVGDREREGLALNNLGEASRKLGQYEKAIGYYEQALAIARDMKDRPGEGGSLNNLGIAYEALSEYDKAIGYLEQALAIARESKDRRIEVYTLGNFGLTYDRLSQYEKAIGYYEQALAIARDIKNRRSEGIILGNLGLAYSDMKQYEKAIGYHEQALAIKREVKDRFGEGHTLNDLGIAYKNLGQYEKAIGYYEQALAIARDIKDRPNEGRNLNNLGNAYSKLSQYEKAIGYYEQALAIHRETKNRRSEGIALTGLGDVYSALSQHEKAIAYYVQALAISREIKDRSDEALEQSGLMEVWQASGKPRLAIFYGKQAVNTVQSMRSDIAGLSPNLQQGFLKGNEDPYRKLSEILIAQGRLAEAEQVLALLKEEEYFQYIRRDAGEASSLNRRADLTPEEAEYEKRYRDIGDRLMTIGVERGELLAKKTLTPEQSQRLDQLEQDLAAGNQAFGHFLGDLTQHFSAKPEMTGRIEDLRETQGIMEDLRDLPAGTVAIFTLIADDKLYTILRTPDAQKKYEYPIKAADLNRKILEFHQVVQDPELDPRPLAHELYKILIGGMADDLRLAKAQTLMWELDGPLRYVPLAALYDGKQYLIEQYRVSVMTLASKSRLKDPPAREWQAAGFGVTKGFEDAAALPSVSSELAGIITTMPGDGGVLAGEIKLDDRFTEQSMRDTLHKRYPVIHIASHFRFQPGDDAKSFLLLGDGGHLTLAELKTWANLFGGVQLLTLSACNTGVGDGAEVEGFGALAQIQGAKAVVASLWPVADASTSRLMQEFYRIRESPAGVTKLEALREAQLALLRGAVQIEPAQERSRGVVVNQASSGAARPEAPSFPISARAPYAHPYYWAPFFLMGNWL